MDKLPTELLHCVFVRLSILQNTKCMLVCKKWAGIIRTRSLLHTICVNNESTLTRIITLLNQKPEMALQVETLCLSGCRSGYFHKDQFPMIFPNLKYIEGPQIGEHIVSIRPNSMIPKPPGTLCSRSGYRNQVEHVFDFNYGMTTDFFAQKGFFSRLVTLEFTLSVVFPSDTLKALKDMPSLKMLTIYNCDVSLNSLEALHINVPSLETLKLHEIYRLSGNIRNNIAPATRLTGLEMWEIRNEQAMDKWLQYIRKKYKHLKHFDYGIDVEDFTVSWREMYSVQFPLFLKGLASPLEALALYSNLDRDCKILKSLDKYEYHIKRLDLNLWGDENKAIDALCGILLFKRIEELSLREIPIGTKIGTLRGMEKLKILILEFYQFGEDDTSVEVDISVEEVQQEIMKRTLNLTKLFRNLPASTYSVTITDVYIDYDENDKRVYPITQLYLDHTRPLKRIDAFISNCIPHLHDLILDTIFQFNGTFKLPNHHFSRLELIEEHLVSTYNIALVTYDKMKTLYYSNIRTPVKGYSGLNQLYLPIPSHYLPADKVITFKCGSVKRLLFNEKEAFLNDDDVETIS